MPFRRIHKIITYLMAAQGLGLLALSGELTLPGSLLVGVAVVASWFVEGERFASKKWEWLSNCCDGDLEKGRGIRPRILNCEMWLQLLDCAPVARRRL